MVDTTSIFKDLQGFHLPPIDKWQPEHCVDFDIVIDANGKWFHEGALMKRRRLVKLFASVLRREQDGHYYLVTPPTKYRISVEDVPFIIVEMHVEHALKEGQKVYFRTNMDDQVLLSETHPISMRALPESYANSDNKHLVPYVYVRQGLLARLSRNVLFQLADYLDLSSKQQNQYKLTSQGHDFYLQVN